MQEQRDERPSKVLKEQPTPHQPLQIINFNDLRDLRAFAQKLAKLVLEQECHSLRAVEERYSLMTGIAVRYCQILAKNQELSSVVSPPPSFYSMPGRRGIWDFSDINVEFLQQMMKEKTKLAGGQEGIELTTVNYYGREFVIRGIFGGWYGPTFPREGAVDAQYNHLSGEVHLYIYEQDKIVGKLRLRTWIADETGIDRRDIKLCVAQEDLSFLNNVQSTQLLDGNFISDYNKIDTLLGHFLHQLMIEIFQMSGFKQLQFQADDECDLITVANGCWPYGAEDAELTQKMLTCLQAGKSLIHGRCGGSRTYTLLLSELDHPRVYFNGAVEPISWTSLIEKNRIISKPELFAWPQFCGLASPDHLQNQQFCYASVDLEAPVTCAELIKVGRVGTKALRPDLSDIQVCQTAVGTLTSGSLLKTCMILAQFDVLFDTKTKSIPEMMALAVTFDSDGEICRTLFNRILDTVVTQKLLPLEIPNLDNLNVGVTIVDVLNEFLAFEEKNPDSLAVKICKEEIEKRMPKLISK